MTSRGWTGTVTTLLHLIYTQVRQGGMRTTYGRGHVDPLSSVSTTRRNFLFLLRFSTRSTWGAGRSPATTAFQPGGADNEPLVPAPPGCGTRSSDPCRRSLIFLQLAYGKDADARRQVILTCHDEAIAGQLIDRLQPPPGATMAVLDLPALDHGRASTPRYHKSTGEITNSTNAELSAQLGPLVKRFLGVS